MNWWWDRIATTRSSASRHRSTRFHSPAPVDTTAQYYFGNSRVVSTWQVVDNFAYIRGSHAFKFGINLRRVREEDIAASVAGLNAAEEVNFSTSINTVDPTTFGLPSDLNTAFDRGESSSRNINFLLGRVGQIDRGFVNQNDQWTKSTFLFDTRYPEYEFYAQDTWKVRPNLTVDIGLRWEIRLSPNTPNNNILVPNQPIVAGAAPSNTVKWVPGQRCSRISSATSDRRSALRGIRSRRARPRSAPTTASRTIASTRS